MQLLFNCQFTRNKDFRCDAVFVLRKSIPTFGFCKSMKPDISDLISWFPLKQSIELFYPFVFNELKENEDILDFSIISSNRNVLLPIQGIIFSSLH